MHKEMTTYDPTTGFIGFAATCLLFVASHLLDSLTAQNLAYLATFCSGAVNVFYLLRKNRRRKPKSLNHEK